ncbi:MAG: PTS sugar transporter subunit IIA [Candidatus Omnitrophica bacterium]|nr:PTS system fructose-specific EIIABC component [bacterium]MCC6731963.1 PTS sugar transporter subunit IIA [Candidatus Omnitrophota bacterium]MCE7909118.1 PTS sugar transporter subunit IIA [Candidatus Omnitrophica bacterium COP1]MCL4736215.1 PTS sugar transporter subunit IIA [Candidatus Omnitrophota bacterium]
MNLADNLRDGRILISIEGRTKADILKSMIAVLENQGIISNSEKLFADFLDRESKGSTGIGNGIAIPHVRSDQVQQLEYVFANSVEGVDFESLDGEPVHILFLMVAPAGSHGIHIKALARISRILNDEGTRVRLRKATTPDEIIQLIRDREEELG